MFSVVGFPHFALGGSTAVPTDGSTFASETVQTGTGEAERRQRQQRLRQRARRPRRKSSLATKYTTSFHIEFSIPSQKSEKCRYGASRCDPEANSNNLMPINGNHDNQNSTVRTNVMTMSGLPRFSSTALRYSLSSV